jgi:hypothetical protein
MISEMLVTSFFGKGSELSAGSISEPRGTRNEGRKMRASEALIDLIVQLLTVQLVLNRLLPVA